MVLEEIETLEEVKILNDYITSEIDYHQKRYLEGENRAARLAGVCGTLATLLTSAAIAISTKIEIRSSIPWLAYISFSVCILSLFAASVVSLLGILPTDKYGNLTRPIRVGKWIAHIKSATIAMEKVFDPQALIQRLDTDSRVILWTSKNTNENMDTLVIRSKIISLLAFKRSIGVRQITATFAIFLIITAMIMMLTTVFIIMF